MGTFVVKWICSKIIPSMGCLYELGLIFRPTLWPALVILGSKFSINVTRKVDWSSLFRNFSGICRGSIFDVSKNAVCITLKVLLFRSFTTPMPNQIIITVEWTFFLFISHHRIVFYNFPAFDILFFLMATALATILFRALLAFINLNRSKSVSPCLLTFISILLAHEELPTKNKIFKLKQN